MSFKEPVCGLFQTTFFFDVHKTYFRKALDMFAQFFISPLFLKTSMDREIMAVDNGRRNTLERCESARERRIALYKQSSIKNTASLLCCVWSREDNSCAL